MNLPDITARLSEIAKQQDALSTASDAYKAAGKDFATLYPVPEYIESMTSEKATLQYLKCLLDLLKVGDKESPAYMALQSAFDAVNSTPYPPEPVKPPGV